MPCNEDQNKLIFEGDRAKALEQVELPRNEHHLFSSGVIYKGELAGEAGHLNRLQKAFPFFSKDLLDQDLMAIRPFLKLTATRFRLSVFDSGARQWRLGRVDEFPLFHKGIVASTPRVEGLRKHFIKDSLLYASGEGLSRNLEENEGVIYESGHELTEGHYAALVLRTKKGQWHISDKRSIESLTAQDLSSFLNSRGRRVEELALTRNVLDKCSNLYLLNQVKGIWPLQSLKWGEDFFHFDSREPLAQSFLDDYFPWMGRAHHVIYRN